LKGHFASVDIVLSVDPVAERVGPIGSPVKWLGWKGSIGKTYQSARFAAGELAPDRLALPERDDAWRRRLLPTESGKFCKV
jgi:hypothetical protein